MGYWNSGKDGSSLHLEKTGLIWGDRPADVIDESLERIYALFIEDVGRAPTADEIRSGLEFSLKGFLLRKGHAE